MKKKSIDHEVTDCPLNFEFLLAGRNKQNNDIFIFEIFFTRGYTSLRKDIR